MSTNYPSNLDSFTKPSSTDPRSGATSASTLFGNITDAVTALETKVGKDGSATTTTHDYKLSGVTGTDKAVSKTGTETLTNKTLTAPVINIGSDSTGDMYYRNSGGNLSRLPIGTSGQILDVSATGIPEWIANPSASNASTTVKGVVEAATSSEVTAGTGTGGTGAVLVVTPDSLAGSTPTFNASNLTNIPIPVGSFVGTVTTATSTTNGANVDTTFTAGFTAKNITIYFSINGQDNSAGKYGVGIATFNGTTLTGVLWFQKNTIGNTTAFNYTNSSIDTSSIVIGGTTGVNYAQLTLTVNSVTSTQFVVRASFLTSNTGVSATAVFYPVATQ